MNRRSMMIALLALGLMGSPLFAAADQARPAEQAHPGTVNYVEGAAYLEGTQLKSGDVGTTSLDAGQVLTTEKGKAEILLTPGVFLRLDDNSAVKMISPDLTLTQVELQKGRVGIEVDEIHEQNNLQIIDAGVTTRLDKRGYYEFDANKPAAMVFTGEAHAQVADGKWKEIKGHHEMQLAASANGSLAAVKTSGFDENSAKDELYNWNSLRSQYMAEANNEMAGKYAGPIAGPGWYWDPSMFGYTYMGVGPFASPFGWGFYPFGWGGWYPGYYGRGYYGGRYGYAHGYSGFRNGGNFGGFGNGGSFGGFHGGGGHR
jgi:hypothetical protein